jgi:hypothetical protein
VDERFHRILSGFEWFMTGFALHREHYSAMLIGWVAREPELLASGACGQEEWRIDDGC